MIPPEYPDWEPFGTLELSVRAYNCLAKPAPSAFRFEPLKTIGDFRHLMSVASDEDLLHIRGLGKKTLAELRDLEREIE